MKNKFVSSKVFILAAVLILGSCKTVKEFAGEGPLVMTPNIKEFVDRMTSNNQGIVAVAYNGRYAYAYGCSSGPQCAPDAYDPVAVIKKCEEKAPRCGIYAEDGFVVWKGSINVSGASRPTPASLSAKDLCEKSLANVSDSSAWETSRSGTAEEARRRGFSYTDCRRHAGYANDLPKAGASPSENKTVQNRLKKLKDLLDKGLITPDDAKKKRDEILKNL